MVCVRPSARRRLAAGRLGRYPSLSAASRTRSTRSGATVGTSLKTRDTVLIPTPDNAATCRLVARSRRPSPTPSSVTPVLSRSEGPGRLEGGVAAVDHEDGTCHEAGCGAGQEEYGWGDLLGQRRALLGRVADPAGRELRPIDRRHVRADVTGCHRVHAHPEW